MNIFEDALSRAVRNLPDSADILPFLKDRPDVSESKLRLWEDTVIQVRDLALGHGWSKSETAQRADIPESTFSIRFSGKHDKTIHNITLKVVRRVEGFRDMEAIDGLDQGGFLHSSPFHPATGFLKR